MRKFLLAALLISYSLHAQDTDFDAIQIKVNDVAPGVYFLEGNGGNVGVSVGDDGVFIIDDDFAELSDKIKAVLARLHPAPVKFVLNTHFHFDHTGGNGNFGADGAILVAQDKARDRLTRAHEFSMLGLSQQAYGSDGLPKLTFTEEMTLHFNGNTVNVRHLGPAHTDTDAIYHFIEANVIHTGDIFVTYGLPFIDVPNGGNLNGTIRAMHQIIVLANDATRIIPGHGTLSTKADMVAYVQMLETVRDRVWDGVRQGKTLEAILATEPTRGFDNGGLVSGENFTRIAYDSFFK
jgi:cyclase